MLNVSIVHIRDDFNYILNKNYGICELILGFVMDSFFLGRGGIRQIIKAKKFGEKQRLFA